jgi:4-amino-4-deoxy-L-arabinose transferase-like glycosyltransferase
VLTAPWYLYLLSVVGNAQGQLLHEYKAERMEFQPPYYYLGLLGLMLPWSIWLVGGLIQPYMRSSGEARRRLMVAWAWFVLIFVAFSIPGAKQQRYILPIVPAAALLIGQLWRYHEDLAQRGEKDPGVNLLRVPHWAMAVSVSLLAWPFFVSQGWMVRRGWFDTVPIGDVPMLLAASAGIMLTVLAVLGARWHFQWRPMRAALAMSLWSSVLMTLVWYAWSTGERSVHPVKASAQRVAQVVDGAVIVRLKHRLYPFSPNEEFLLYSRRIIKPVRRKDIGTFGASHPGDVFMIAPIQDAVNRLLRRKGYRLEMDFQHDYNEKLSLWKYVGKSQPPTPVKTK